MNAPPDYVIEAARAIAAAGPCAKSKRGVVLFNAEDAERFEAIGAPSRAAAETGIIAARAFNGPPTGFSCTGSLACRSACARVCVHAEQRAIIRALGCDDAVDLELVHVKVVDGAVVPGKAPCCVECSRLVVEVGLRGVWLFEAQRWHTEVRCKACWKVTIIPQGAGTTGVCAQCDEVYRLLELPGEQVFDVTSGVWRFYSAVDFHRTTMRNLGIATDTARDA